MYEVFIYLFCANESETGKLIFEFYFWMWIGSSLNYLNLFLKFNKPFIYFTYSFNFLNNFSVNKITLAN